VYSFNFCQFFSWITYPRQHLNAGAVLLLPALTNSGWVSNSEDCRTRHGVHESDKHSYPFHAAPPARCASRPAPSARPGEITDAVILRVLTWPPSDFLPRTQIKIHTGFHRCIPADAQRCVRNDAACFHPFFKRICSWRRIYLPSPDLYNRIRSYCVFLPDYGSIENNSTQGRRSTLQRRQIFTWTVSFAVQ
jgi:hypothetical protein